MKSAEFAHALNRCIIAQIELMEADKARLDVQSYAENLNAAGANLHQALERYVSNAVEERLSLGGLSIGGVQIG